MSTDVIYVRVPSALKEAVEAHAASRGSTLTSAVVELLELGMEANQNAISLRALEERYQELAKTLDSARTAQQHEQARREAVEQQYLVLQGAARVWSERAEQEVGRCPHTDCHQPIHGYDLLVSGRCSSCKRTVNSMLAPDPQTSRLKWDDVLPVLVAAGVVLGAVAATRGKALTLMGR